MSNNQLIYKNGCWGCKRAIESPKEYVCPKLEQHWQEYKELKKYE